MNQEKRQYNLRKRENSLNLYSPTRSRQTKTNSNSSSLTSSISSPSTPSTSSFSSSSLVNEQTTTSINLSDTPSHSYNSTSSSSTSSSSSSISINEQLLSSETQVQTGNIELFTPLPISTSETLPAQLPLVKLNSISPSNTITVTTNFQIFRVHEIDSSNEKFTIDCGISFRWDDPHLAKIIDGQAYSSHPAIVR